MKNGFRQSMAWLHTWTGLLLGWLLFAIFLTGTIAYFRPEVTLWMQPELHRAQSGADATGMALARLAQLAPDAASWAIVPPNERSNAMTVSWRMSDQTGGRDAAARVLDPLTGQELIPRQTAGGEFLYRFHFELYGLPRNLARWIVGIATMAMFVAIISGVITHKKIFKDFFTFRPGKGQRSWLDMHNMTAVLALPYYLMITYSGLVLFAATLMPFVSEGRGPRAAPPPPAQVIADPPALAPLPPMLAQAATIWAMPVGRIEVQDRLTAAPQIVLSPLRNARLDVHSGSGSNGVERLRFDAQSGALIDDQPGPQVGAVGATVNMLGSLHRGRFADLALRWLFFLSGAMGTVMVATGLLLWVSKRRAKHAKARHLPRGVVLVDRLNIGGIAGLSLATAGYFWANRLLPVAMPDRAAHEIHAFFVIWLLAALHGFLRDPRRAWIEQLSLTGLLLLSLPALNSASGGLALPLAVIQGNWLVASVDLAALLGGLAYCRAALMLRRPAPKAATARERRA